MQPTIALIRNTVASLSLLALAACSGVTSSDLKSVQPPSYDDIAAEYVAFQKEWANLGGTSMSDPEKAKRYVVHGFDLAERSCLQYFVKIRETRNKTTFASNTLSSLFAAGGVIAGLSGVAAPVLVGIFAGAGLVPSTVKSFNNIYLLAEVADDLYPAIQQQMADYRADHNPDGSRPRPLRNPKGKLMMMGKLGKPVIWDEKDRAQILYNDTLPFDRWTAVQIVREHAAMCSLPAMISVVNASIKNMALDLDPETGIVTTRKPPPAD